MITKFKTYLPAVAVALAISSCSKMQDVGILNTGNFPADETSLKSAASFPIGVAINYGPMTNEQKFSDIVKRDFSQVVCGYEMKHGAVVQNNGSFNFTQADALVAAVGSMDVFGHTLGWHQNQNATYLKNYAGITLPAATELLPGNVGFESGNTNWSIFNTNGATITFQTGDAANAHAGNSYMKVVNPTAQTGNQWKVQVSSAAFATTVGKQYVISYWVKAASAGGSIRLSTGGSGSAQYQGDQTIGTTWQQVTWQITANGASTTFLFDMGQVANTYYIDDASTKEVIQVPSGAQVSLKVDTALKTFVTTMVTRYKSKIRAWDVINELFTDNGAIRNNSNTANTASDVFVWSEYLGRDYALKAFTYAQAADPTADLFINDYNLESSSQKLDSLISFVSEIKTKGAKVSGIGTQMHVTVNTSYAGIDAMFKKLAATGLKIRVSELDVRLNPVNKPDYVSVPVPAAMLASQADMFKYIVSSYIQNVPQAQRAGITIWGVNDKNSWLYSPLSTNTNVHDYPLLYDNDYNKKSAYSGVLQALKAQ
jgi:endo-1,4-beta-xylanase